MKTLDESIIRVREISGMLEAAMDLGGAAQALAALEWVRDRGGLDAVREQRRESIPRAAYERKKAGWLGHIEECEEALARRNMRIAELKRELKQVVDQARETCVHDSDVLAWVEKNGGLDAVKERTMPEDMSWPRYTDGSLVEIGCDVVGPNFGECIHVDEVTFHANGFTLRERTGLDEWYESDDRFERPAPKVLDADGVEISVGDTVYHVEDGSEMTVYEIDGEWLVVSVGGRVRHDIVTHRAPVLAADGKPLREGETVYEVGDGDEHIVGGFLSKTDGQVVVQFRGKGGCIGLYPKYLTHERPDSWKRLEDDAVKPTFKYWGCPVGGCDRCSAKVDGKKPWERFGTDGDCNKAKELEIVRRAKALAERGQ